MTEQSPETIQKQDLTGVLAHVPRDVIELLGEEEVAQVESLLQLASGLLELSRMPDPFLKESGSRTEVLIRSEVNLAMEEVRAIRTTTEDSGDPQLSIMARRNALILKAAAKSYRTHIADNYDSNHKKITELKDRITELDSKDADDIATSMPGVYEVLEAVAAGLVQPRLAEDLKELLRLERQARYTDEKVVGLRNKPHLQEALAKIWVEGLEAGKRHNQGLAKKKREDHTKLTLEIENRGRKNWRVRRAHRGFTDIWRDEKFVDSALEGIGSLRELGSELHGLMSLKAIESSHGPSSELMSSVAKLRKKLYADLNALEFPDFLADEDMREAVLTTEAYIVDRAKQAEELMRRAKFKLSPAQRRAVNELKEPKVRKSARDLGNVAIRAEVNPYDDVEASNDFRALCRAARDILIGGGRIDHPEARRLAEELHRLRLGTDGSDVLAPAESGLIVAIVTDKLDPLMAVVERLELSAYAEDIQLAKLHYDLPEQHGVLADFDLDAALEKLKTIVDNQRDAQALLSAMPDEETYKRVKAIIQYLWQQRNEIEAYQEDQLEETLAETIDTDMVEDTELLEAEEIEDEPQEVEEPGQEELDLINVEMTEIADQLEWVVFPKGTNLDDIKRTLGENSVDLTRVNWERIEHLLYLKDNFDGKIYRSSDAKLGTSVPYLVAEITAHGHRFAVAECPEIGNATYVVDDMVAGLPWEELMRLSKADARNLGARRIIHPKETGHLHKIVRCINSMLTIKAS